MVQPEISPDQDGCRVSGDLVFATVTQLLAVGEKCIRDSGKKSLVFDCAAVGRADSAGVALLLEWLDRARQQGVCLQFRNLPDGLMSIAQLSNVDGLLLADGS
ncbi:MAG: STAS domain-containing protein [Chromatiales bacterium]|nr:STAS domain-containing protein [Chromatiales bacterium]